MASFTAMFCFGLSVFLMFHVMEAYDPTKGFISLPFNTSVYRIQKPYDKQENQRYSFKNGVHKLWVFSNDKPHTTTSHTKPRTEIAILILERLEEDPDRIIYLIRPPHSKANLWVEEWNMDVKYMILLGPSSKTLRCQRKGYSYSSGIWEFAGDAYVPKGTTGVTIMQVFGASAPHASTLMLRVYDGKLMYYRDTVLVPNIYNRWFHVNVVHNVDAAKVMVYIDGQLKMTADGRGGTSHIFKCGVYAQTGDSFRMESWWKNINVMKHV